MGNVESTENGRAPIACLEAVIRDPSLILGESPQALVIRHRLAAQSAIQSPSAESPLSHTHTKSGPDPTEPNPELPRIDSARVACPSVMSGVATQFEGEGGLPNQYGASPPQRIQGSEVEQEGFQIIHPPSPLRDQITVINDDLAPNAQIVAQFVGNSGYFS